MRKNNIVLICFAVVIAMVSYGCSKSKGSGQSNGASTLVGLEPVVFGGDEVEGWAGVTAAVEPLGGGRRFDVGEGKTYEELSQVPWQTLGPGDVVNIHYRTEPYRSKIALTRQGTSEAPIVVNGVTDSQGNRPVISGQNALTVDADAWGTILPPYSLWTVVRSRDGGSYGTGGEWIEIKNLRFKDAYSDYNFDGNSTYGGAAAGLRIQNGKNITIQGCIFENNGNGVFTQMSDPNEPTLNISLRGNKFFGNGHVGSYLEHNAYLQAASTEVNVVEGNYFGILRDGARGLSLKTRMTDTIIRYNTIVGDQRALDIVEAQDGLPYWMDQNYTQAEFSSRYYSAHIYGNVFIVDASYGSLASYPVHIGMDTGSGHSGGFHLFSASGTYLDGVPMSRGYGDNVYFYYNTVYHNSSESDAYRVGIFDTDAGGSTVSAVNSTIVAANNIFYFASSSSVTYMRQTGVTQYVGSNLIFHPNADLFEGYDLTNDDPEISIVEDDMRFNIDPRFLDPIGSSYEDKDFRLSESSPVKRVADTELASVFHQVHFQPVAPALGGGAIQRNSVSAIGALE